MSKQPTKNKHHTHPFPVLNLHHGRLIWNQHFLVTAHGEGHPHQPVHSIWTELWLGTGRAQEQCGSPGRGRGAQRLRKCHLKPFYRPIFSRLIMTSYLNQRYFYWVQYPSIVRLRSFLKVKPPVLWMAIGTWSLIWNKVSSGLWKHAKSQIVSRV